MDDCWSLIASHIDSGYDWKSFIFTCKAFHNLNSEKTVAKFSNHLWTLIHLFPDKKWNWIYISKF